jgi:hypothetical protein
MAALRSNGDTPVLGVDDARQVRALHTGRYEGIDQYQRPIDSPA